ncbi:MAG TPA: HAMP domain-containing sensor histidine kinase [Hansschlegelia sp.]
MTVRQRILLVHAVVVLFTGAMILVLLAGLRFNEDFIRRIDGVHQRFEALAELDGHANNYAEQIAEVLLLGDEQREDFRAATEAMDRGFAKLKQVTRDEVMTLGTTTKVRAELGDIEVVVRLEAVYGAIAAAADRVFKLKADGDGAGAIALFRNEVEYRLANDFENMIESALRDERGEVATELAEVRASHRSLFVWALIISVVATLVSAGLGALLHRNVVEPVRRLKAGADAVASGDLAHRVAIAGGGEFRSLSDSFNAMAETLQTQQARLTGARERLELDVADRTSELRRANEQLEALNEQRSRFLADVSHELRTPLTVLRGEADVSLRGESRDASDYRRSLERIRSQTAAMARLLEDLLAFARAEANDLSFSPERLDLREVARRAAREGELLADSEGVHIDVMTGEEPAPVSGDLQRLNQVLMIGIDNALKHSQGRDIVVSAFRRGDEGVIEVADRGVGLGEADQTRVFERFYRGRDDAGEDREGLGIGLAIARAIIERHGGDIALRPNGSTGAVLSIALPIVE